MAGHSRGISKQLKTSQKKHYEALKHYNSEDRRCLPVCFLELVYWQSIKELMCNVDGG